MALANVGDDCLALGIGALLTGRNGCPEPRETLRDVLRPCCLLCCVNHQSLDELDESDDDQLLSELDDDE